ncbi:ATP-binding cassette domain-containing protein [Chloroflexia bacterium SDU3-3]|nr:ATP-binding cassette domain-containing protein [Chloroflexia bacterium SDU3-3]
MTQGVAIQLERVEKRFAAQPVLSRLDLAIAPGEFVAVIGKSGSGKSTLLRLVAGLDVPSAGAVVIDGQPLRARNSEARVMFQDARLLPWKSVLENVGLGLPASGLGQRAAEALEHVGLHDRGGAWPLVLSGGERQRVALARALVSGPRLLLLDEPLGALDALTRIEMQLLIERLWQEQGFTAVLITHDVEEAVALADRVVLIEHGQIALDQRVDLPRPRARGSAAFAALKGQLLQRVIGSGWDV